MSVLVQNDEYEIQEISVTESEEVQDQTHYRAVPVGANTDIIEVDINAPSGIYKLDNSGHYKWISVRYEVALKRLGADKWKVYKYQIAGRTPNEIGFTHRYNLPLGVYDVAIYRLGTKSNDSSIMDKVFCNGLKSVIAKPERYNDITTILMRITGDKVLSEMNENQLSTIWKRKLPNIKTAELEKTTSLAPAVKYIVQNSKYPNILDDESLEEYSKKWNNKCFGLNGVLDKDNTLLDVLKDVLNVGFAEPIVKAGKLLFSEQGIRNQNDLSYIFQPQNITASPNLTAIVPQSDDVREIVAEWMNPDTWKTDQIYVHSAASNDGEIEVTEYPTSVYSDKISLFGVTSKKQAVSMAARRLNYLKYTNFNIELKTELEGLNVSYNDFVGCYIDQFVNAEKCGRVIAYDNQHRTILLTNVTSLTEEEKETLIIRDTSGKPHICKVIETSDYVSEETGNHYLKCKLELNLPFKWSKFYGSKYEYPYFVAGLDNLMFCWVQNVTNSGDSCTVKLVNYDPRVYKKDIYVLSGWGHCPWGHCPWGHA